MLPIRFHFVSGPARDALRAGGSDGDGDPAERAPSDGSGIPCRCCPGLVSAGRPCLIAAWRPFDRLQPHAGTGPVFLCADCKPAAPALGRPTMFGGRGYIDRGDDAAKRIVYGTGGVVPRHRISALAAEPLARAGIAHVDVRSAANSCRHARIRRA